jgi:hypothetical protein
MCVLTTVDPVVGPVYVDERLADVAQRGFAVQSQLPFDQHDARGPGIARPADGVVG